jgi:isoquinoline 1-oxidoreductase beta subunit
VKIATLAQSPVFGGRVKSVDDTAAKAVKGVRQIVRLDDAVAVVADHMGAAKKGLGAQVIEWDDGPHAKLTRRTSRGELEQATLKAGRGRAEHRRRRQGDGGAAPRSRRPTRCRSSRTPRWSR